MIGKAAKHAALEMLRSAGYRVYHSSVLPYGLEFMPDVDRLARAWNLPIRTFIDIGAHEGQTSRAALAQFPETKVYAFEPHPATFGKLLQGVGGEPRVSTQNLAVSDTRGTVPFYEYGSSTLNSLIPDAQYAVRRGVGARTLTVDCTTLDAFCEEQHIEFVDVLKIDTEGCELLVLTGARDLLSSGRVRFVYAEFNDMCPRPGATGGALNPISEFLAPFGFRFVATYFDHMEIGKELHIGANALFVRPPHRDA